MDNIFDLDNLDDLPNEIKSAVTNKKKSAFERKIIQLFGKAGTALNIDQVMVGYNRLYKGDTVKSRHQISVKLYNMCKKKNPAIEAVSGARGVYRIKK